MAWDTRLKAAWHGEASGADLAAMFATTAGLSGLKQALADRCLEAEIEQTGHDWRAVLAVGRIAAPLWLADTLVGLAGAFYDAETRSHPDRPSSVSRPIFDVVAALLAPVEDIIAEVTAALADPNHRTALAAPLRIRPGGDIASDAPPGSVSGPYAQGLAAGARQVHTSAAAALASVRTEVARSEAPDWLSAGLQRLDGELQGAGARLDMSEARLTSLAATRSSDPATLVAICGDLWKIVDVSAVAGQVIADPHLLPEAATAQRGASPAPARMPPMPSSFPFPPATSHPAAPRRAPVEVDPLPLPVIDPGAAPLEQRRERMPSPEAPSAGVPSPDVSLPVIGESPRPQAPARTPPPETSPSRERQKPDTANDATDSTDEEPTIRFPEIG
ncbi:MAG TPA: hypothetical protein VKT52_10170 [Ktedonobacterales bacterium]|nr:hypothetical protein [Ktedonobacterales bacterium]